MPCLALDYHPSRLPAATANHCKSLSSLVREAYAHCHVPCVRIPGAAGWSSGEDTDDDDDAALDTKQVVLNEMRNREMKRRSSRSSVEYYSPTTLSSAFIWSFTPLDARSVLLEKLSSPEKNCIVVEEEGEKKKEEEEEEGEMDQADDDGVESEAYFSVKSFFTRSTSRAATVASSAADVDHPSPAAWEGLRNCDGWPFGLCRRPAVPPLPSTPADSWKWRNRSSSATASPRGRPDRSPAPACGYKVATTG